MNFVVELAIVCIISIIDAMSSRDVINRLKREGWRQVRSKGSHRQFKHPEISGLVTVPHPKQDIPKGTLRSIFRQAGWSDK